MQQQQSHVEVGVGGWKKEPYDAGEVRLVFGLLGLCIVWIVAVAVWKRWRASTVPEKRE